MQNCDHDLIEMGRTVPKGKNRIVMVDLVCAYCGHTRRVHSDGIIEISLKTGLVRKMKS